MSRAAATITAVALLLILAAAPSEGGQTTYLALINTAPLSPPNPIAPGGVNISIPYDAFLCTDIDFTVCISNSTVRLNQTFTGLECNITALPTFVEPNPPTIGGPWWYNLTDNGSYLYQVDAGNTTGFPQMQAPSAPGSYQLVCAAYTPLSYLYSTNTQNFNVTNYSPPPASPPPPKTPTRKPTPQPTKPKTCPAGQYRASASCHSCIAADSPFTTLRGGASKIKCVRPATLSSTSTTCEDAILPAYITYRPEPSATLKCIPYQDRLITIALPTKSSTIPFLSIASLVKDSLRLNLGIPPVTNNKGNVVYTVGKQSGQKRVLVTFDAGPKGMRAQRGQVVRVTGVVARSAGATSWCFSSYVRVCS